MLISATTRIVIEVAGGMVFLAGGVLFMVAGRGAPPQLPAMRVVQRRRTRRITAAPIVLLGILTMYWAGRHDMAVLVVRDGHSTYGNRTFERRLATDLDDYQSVQITDEVDPGSLADMTCWLVNESSGRLRYERLDYQYKGSDVKVTGTVEIAPHQRAPYCPSFGNDYIGPNFPPPENTKETARTLRASAWLTWD